MKIQRTERSSHWYDWNGKPCHEVIAKTTGLPRPTTVADARKLNLLPSVTNVIGVKAKPALITWMQDNAIMAACETTRGPDEPEHVWHSRIAVEADRIGTEAAAWGTLLHAEIEHWNEHGAFESGPEVTQFLTGYAEWHRENVTKIISQEQSVVGPLGYAGRLDMLAEMKDGRIAVVDFKSQKLLGKKSPNFYKEWSIQLAAYAAAVGGDLDLISVIIPSDAPGKPYVKEWENREVAWKAFKACFNLWCFEKDYTPEAKKGGGK